MNTAFAQKTKTAIAGAALLAGTVGLSGCFNIEVSGFEGETLDNLDKGGDAPTEIALAGPDELIVKTGKKLKIKVSGDEEAIEALRFKRDGKGLTVGRDGDTNWDSGKATVTITMPAPTDISMFGSGSITAEEMADDADISMAGSGSINVTEMDVDKLEVSSAGSGSIKAAGKASKLEVNIMGSGGAQLKKLTADEVDVTIAGSGGVRVASDGKVEASIVGSGSVVVTGDAECKSSTVGSGSLTCKSAK